MAPPPVKVSIRDLVSREISDPARAEKVAALMERMDAEITAQKDMMQQAQQEFKKINEDYNTTREQVQNFLEADRKKLEKNRQDILDLYFQIKALTTPEEWQAISLQEDQSIQSFKKKYEVRQ